MKILAEARTRILLWYLLLMSVFIGIAIPTIRQRLYAKVQERVEHDLKDEIEDFENVVKNGFQAEDEQDIEKLKRLRADKIIWTPPKNREELREVFDIHFAEELPEDDVYFIAIINGKFYKSTPRALPEIIDRNSNFMHTWKKLTQRSQNEISVNDPKIESILYIADPFLIPDGTTGVFVVAHVTAGEREEAREALQVMMEVVAVVFILASSMAWWVAGRVLKPLRTLRETAKSISETNLTKRIPVHGRGEIADLAKTFNGMMDRLELAFQTQRDFINDAGHELRTPITIIRGHLELMGDDPQEQQETITLVMDELDRMNRFVDDLLLLAKAERPDFLHLETVDVANFTEELFLKATALAPRNWKLGSLGKGNVVIDRQRVTQAVMNLAQNATQYTSKDDTITIGSGVSKGKVCFWVADTGEGIPATDQKRIFERFARGTSSRRRSEGAGLGLAIVKVVAEAHRGQVYLKSQLGTGSTFTIVMPVEPPPEV